MTNHRNECRAFVLLLLLSIVALAQTQVGRIQVLVAPDHPYWTYAPGEKASSLIRAVRDANTLGGVKLTYTIGLEMMMPAVTQSATLDAEGLVNPNRQFAVGSGAPVREETRRHGDAALLSPELCGQRHLAPHFADI